MLWFLPTQEIAYAPPTPSALVDYSIVIPVYFNEGALTPTLDALLERVINRHPELSAEIIFVDDGSDDGSLAELLRLRKQHPQLITVIKLTRNFGQTNALLAGFTAVRGRCAVAMSADGQDPADLINQMLEAHFQQGFEVVVCARQGRDESYFRILTSRLFYALMRRLSFPNMPPGGFDFVLMRRRALRVFLHNQEAHPFFQGQVLWMGFNIKFIEYRRLERKIGRSRWTFGKKLTYLIDGLAAYSFYPIRLMSAVGILIALLGFLYALLVFVARLIWGNPVQGWTPLMIVVLILGGFQTLMLGIIGEYLWRTLAQVRNRDRYIVDSIYERALSGEEPGTSSTPS